MQERNYFQILWNGLMVYFHKYCLYNLVGQFKLQMEKPIGEQIVHIIKNHEKFDAIIKLFQLTHQQNGRNLSKVQQAILYLLEAQHDWENIHKYAFTWKVDDWIKQYLTRMRQRLNQPNTPINLHQIKSEVEKLARKYWQSISPKKTSKSYDEYLQPKREESAIADRFSFKPTRVETSTSNAIKFNIDKISEKQIKFSMDKLKEKQIKVQPKVEKKSIPKQEMPILPSQVEKPVTPVKKIFHERIKIVNQSPSSPQEDFSFSAVRMRQVASTKKPQQNALVLDFDDSNAQFQQFQEQRRKAIMSKDSPVKKNKNFFNQQEMALINMNAPVNNLAKDLLKKNGITMKEMLRKQLQKVR